MNAAIILKSKPIFLALLILNTLGLSSHAQTNSLPSQIGTNKFYSASGKWMRASNTNCVVWDSFPREGESVTWSGAVVDGKATGKGMVQWFTNGVPTTSYEGEVKGGLLDGHGIAHGYGATFEGEFKHGSLISKTMTFHYATGGWYKGENEDGFKGGQGEEMMPGNVKYVGHFKRDRLDGAGTLILSNGDTLTGQWKDSELAGVGTYTPTNGDSFKVIRTDKGIVRQ